jgi:hypothetical protein
MHNSWKSRGWGSLGFLTNSFEGLTCVVKNQWKGSLLLHFYVEVFKNLYRGYMRCTPSPPSRPLCASMGGFEEIQFEVSISPQLFH